MSEKPSLIHKADADHARQPMLFSPGEIPDVYLHDREAKGEFTGERLHQRNPAKYRAIVNAFAQGMGKLQIARAFQVSHNTVSAVLEREGGPIDTEKRKIAGKMMNVARLGVERLEEEIERMPLQNLPIAVGIMVDKMQLLHGEATQRVEHVQQSEIEDWNSFVDSLPRTIDVESEVMQGTGSGAGKLPAKRERALECNEPSIARTVDSQSPVLSSLPGSSVSTDDACDDKSPSNPTSDQATRSIQEGGEGVADLKGGAEKPVPFAATKNFSQRASSPVKQSGSATRIAEINSNISGSY